MLGLLVVVPIVATSLWTTATGGERGQRVEFAPAIATRSAAGEWLVTVQGRVFEPPQDSKRRQLAVDALAPLVGAARDNPLFRSRAGYLVSDSIEGARVPLSIGGRVGDRVVDLPPSDPAGYFGGEVTLSASEVAALAKDGRVALQTAPNAQNPERFTAIATWVPDEGLTVVTDMDDTIKDTHVNDRAQAKANTFVLPFRPVPGMPELYRAWKAAGPTVHFHVVSAGPWHLHPPLRRFTEEAGYPDFTWSMRSIDITHPARLLEETVKPDPQRLYDFKVASIRALIKRLPNRRLVLVGDSGERDPEVYATIANEFPGLVDAVFIRNVTNEGQGAERYRALFGGAAGSKLRVFVDPAELPRRLEFAR